jgi:hypothetical protein
MFRVGYAIQLYRLGSFQIFRLPARDVCRHGTRVELPGVHWAGWTIGVLRGQAVLRKKGFEGVAGVWRTDSVQDFVVRSQSGVRKVRCQEIRSLLLEVVMRGTAGGTPPSEFAVKMSRHDRSHRGVLQQASPVSLLYSLPNESGFCSYQLGPHELEVRCTLHRDVSVFQDRLYI